jgi:two-component system, sensor histidine kinase and response regulator
MGWRCGSEGTGCPRTRSPQCSRAATGTCGSAPNPAVEQSPASRALRVLLVEDNSLNQLLVTRLLQKRSHAVVTAGTGEEALQRLDSERFDLVLMDVQMPGMDGLETAAAIRVRERQTGRRVPIVASTAHALESDEELCHRAGMDAYLAKPIEPSKLPAVIRELVPTDPDDLGESSVPGPAGSDPAAEG